MTSPDDVPLDGPRDGSRDDPSKGSPDGPVEPGLPFGPSFDEEAAWRLIVENYGEVPQVGSPATGPATGPANDPAPEGPVDAIPSAPTAPSIPSAPSAPSGPSAPSVEPGGPDELDPATRPDSDRNLFDRAYLDALESSYDPPRDPGGDGGPVRDVDQGDRVDGDDLERHNRRRTDDHDHFVPPEPPPVPRGTPARRLAWAGLFAPPVLLILAVVFSWTLPTWLSMLLVAGFVGGFVFLVMTMPRDGGDGWGDGAVV